jgi:hypothetical protein
MKVLYGITAALGAVFALGLGGHMIFGGGDAANTAMAIGGVLGGIGAFIIITIHTLSSM